MATEREATDGIADGLNTQLRRCVRHVAGKR